MASRKSRRSVLTASRACHRSTLAMVIDALANARVARWSLRSDRQSAAYSDSMTPLVCAMR